jgi:hypothetical protein
MNLPQRGHLSLDRSLLLSRASRLKLNSTSLMAEVPCGFEPHAAWLPPLRARFRGRPQTILPSAHSSPSSCRLTSVRGHSLLGSLYLSPAVLES